VAQFKQSVIIYDTLFKLRHFKLSSLLTYLLTLCVVISAPKQINL